MVVVVVEVVRADEGTLLILIRREGEGLDDRS